MKIKQAIQTILILGATVLAASSQAQGVLLFNNGQIGGGASYNINTVDVTPSGSDTFQIADSFTLTAASIIQSATIGVWTSPGDPLTAVTWSITTAPFPGTNPLFSAGANPTDTPLFQNSAGDTVSSDSFQLGSIELPAGTYWLQLDTSITLNGGMNGNASWDVSGGPSSAVEGIVIFDHGRPSQFVTNGIGSESFQLYGTAAPEPSNGGADTDGRLGSGVPPSPEMKCLPLNDPDLEPLWAEIGEI